MNLRLPLAVTLLTISLAAQQPFYFPDRLGQGCTGTGSNACLGANTRGGLLIGGTTTFTFAIEATAIPGAEVNAVELFTRSTSGTQSVRVELWVPGPTSRIPGRRVASGTMSVGTTPAFYRTRLFPAMRFTVAIPLYIVVGPNPQLMRPVVRTPNARITPHYRRSGAGWAGQFRDTFWAWKLGCEADSNGVPNLTNLNLPRVGRNSFFHLQLREAPSLAPVLFLLGASRNQFGNLLLPFNLGALGAPGCFVRTSGEIMVTVPADRLGQRLISLPIPNNSAVLGLRFFTQCIVGDPAANALGLTVSNGGFGQIGR